MVDEIEFMHMECDEQRGVLVVIRSIDLDNKWCICHAKSYQSAFRKEINSFDTHSEAFDFAENNGCTVICQEYDKLQLSK